MSVSEFLRTYWGRQAFENGDWIHPLPPSVCEMLERTAETIRKTEIQSTLWTLTGISASFFFLIVLAEHWIFPGGIASWGRGLCLFALLGLWGWMIWTRIVPFFRWKLHPYHLASVIEASRPELKNGLLNLLCLLRKKEDGTPEMLRDTQLERQILKILERHTAAQMQWIETEKLVSPRRRNTMRLAAVSLLVIFAVYAVLAPKSSFRSVARTLLPLCEIHAPRRVQIDEIVPGNVVLYQGETLHVEARFRNLKDGETPTLFYSSSDRKYLDVPVSMRQGKAEDGTEIKGIWETELSGNGNGVQETLTWYLEVGDACSETFRVEVRPPLSIQIEEIRLAPPKYSGLPSVRQTGGDILALSGTQAFLNVRTSEPAKKVWLELLNAETRKTQTVQFLPNIADGTASETHFHASVPLTGKFMPGKTDAENTRFEARFRFENAEGKEAPKPLVYRWEISQDRAPELRILDGPEENAEVLSETAVRLVLEAADPDLGLRAAGFCASWNGKRLAIPALLNLPAESGGQKTPFRGKLTFRPSEYGLEAGDEILWWAEAEDTRRPGGNRVQTEPRRLRITDGSGGLEQSQTGNAQQMEREDEDGTLSVSQDAPGMDDLEEDPQKEKKNGPGVESFMEDAEKTDVSLEDDASELNGKSQDGESGEGESASNGGAQTQESGGDGESGGSGENDEEDRDGETGGAGPRTGSTGENADADGDGVDSKNAGESGESGEEQKAGRSGKETETSDEEKGTGTSGKPGTSGNGMKKERNAEPKLAPDGFDPLSESLAEKAKGMGSDEEKQNAESGDPAQEPLGENSSGDPNAGKEPNADKDPKDGASAGNGRNADGREGKNAGQEKKDGSGGSGEEGDGRESDDTSDGGLERSEKTDEKTGKGRNGQEPGQTVSAPLDEDENSEGDGGSETDDRRKKTGKDHGGGAKTEGETPDDASSALSGTEDGSDSAQDLPSPAMEKEKTDGSGLQDSESQRPGREEIEDDGSESWGEEDLRPAEASEKTGTKPDPVSDPGEAVEEILRHRERNPESRPATLPPNEKSPGADGSDAPAPQDVPASEIGEGKAELQEHPEEDGLESASEANGQFDEKKETEAGRSSNQDGSQSGDAGDRKSKNEMKPDNSTEAGGRAGENRGGNRNGAEEQSNQQGLGRDGSNTPNESGAPTGSGGEGPTGERGGNSALADHPTGSSDPQKREGNGSETKTGERQSQEHGAGKNVQKNGNSTASGGSGIGDDVRSLMGTHGNAAPAQKEDAANAEFARRQTVLALEHLRDALDRGDDSLLEYLGWTRDEAREFLEEWEKLNADLDRPGASEEERRRSENAFRNLGLTPKTFRYGNRTETEKQRPAVRSGRRIEAPTQWREHFDAFSRSVGNGE